MKIRKFISLILLIFIILSSGCTKNTENPNDADYPDIINGQDEEGHNEDNEVEIDYIEEKISNMTLEEKVGQLLIVGFQGTDLNEEIKTYINDLKIGGFILFSRNIEDEQQLLNLLNSIKEENRNSNIPLFLSIDEEGGKVSRLPSSFVRLPEAMDVGNKDDEEISYKFGEIIGVRLKSLGFNVNFAPVLDINSNPSNPVIGTRSFGVTVSRVVDNGLKVMSGIRDKGIIPAVKHFPGHGDTKVDSHVNLPTINKTLGELESLELIPFKEAIEEDVEMIMLAHILYPKIDDKYPATMSPKIIKDLLRAKLDYDGVVISDDMTMGAIVNNYTLEEGVISFLKSGGDIALVCHGADNPRKSIDRIIEGVNKGELTEEEINKKVYRILSLKENNGLEDSIIEDIELDEINNKTNELIKIIKD